MVLIRRPVIDAAEAAARYNRQRPQNHPRPRRPLPPLMPPPPAAPPTSPHLLSWEDLADLFGSALANEIAEQRPLKYGRKLAPIMTPAVCEWIYSRHMAPDAPEPLETLVDIGLWNEVITMSGTAVNKYLAPLRNQGVGDES